MKIAIFEADTPLPSANKKYGSYGDIFKSLLNQNGLPHEGISYQHYDVDPEFNPPDLSSVDVLLITGSRSNAWDTHIPWINSLTNYVSEALQTPGKKVLGVCFGHQIIGRALGLPVGRNPKGWELSTIPIELTIEAQKQFGVEGMKMIKLNQFHRDMVSGPLPNHISNLGTTEVCPIQGMYEKGRLWSIQGHPEFSLEIEKELLEYAESLEESSSGISTEVIKQALATVEEGDRMIVAKGMTNFLLE